MIEKHYGTIYITWALATAIAIIVGVAEFTWLEAALCGCVSFGVCLYIWRRK